MLTPTLLERILELKRREAACVGFKASPYDALIDEFEPGASAASVRSLFAELAKELNPLVASIAKRMPKPKVDLSRHTFPVTAQEKLCRDIAAAIGYDFNAGRLDTTAHPFCTGIGPGDCRILTRYHEHRPLESFSVRCMKPGMVFMNRVCRRAFWNAARRCRVVRCTRIAISSLGKSGGPKSRVLEGFAPKFRVAFAPTLDDVPGDELWLAANIVRPSLIRIDADEVTYNLHIILRFELEVELMEGKLQVADLPNAWNERFKALLDSMSHPMLKVAYRTSLELRRIGYFPTYTLGNLLAAQLMEKANVDLPGLNDDMSNGSFGRLTTWLRETSIDTASAIGRLIV